jgi:ribosomal protein L9
MIQLVKEIKSLGAFKVKVYLHSDIQSEINIKVLASDNTQ